MISILGIVLSLGLLITLAYRGVSVLLLAPLTALLAVAFGAPWLMLASYTQIFMVSLGGFVIAYFPLFLLGAVFGKLMEASGAAHIIALGIAAALGERRAILAVVLACAVLTYGGVSLFVVAFAVYPIAQALFRRADIPRRLMPATIALGAFTFTMTALPGTPAIQNAIPMPYFGTTPFAAPGLGLIAAAVMLMLGLWWLHWRSAQARSRGEGFTAEDEAQQPADELAPAAEAAPSHLELAKALLPVAVVIALNYLLSVHVLAGLDTRYLAEARFGATSIEALRGIWAVIAALTAAICLLVALWWSRLPQLKQLLDEGASASALPLLNTASQVGYGAVIASLAGFTLIRDAVLNIYPDNPLISMSIAINILAGITGSASGGMSIALQTLGSTWLQMGEAAGLSPQLLHRVTAVATGGLDTLPHNGAVITLLGICRLTHRQSYLDIAMVAIVPAVAALAVIVALGSLFGSF